MTNQHRAQVIESCWNLASLTILQPVHCGLCADAPCLMAEEACNDCSDKCAKGAVICTFVQKVLDHVKRFVEMQKASPLAGRAGGVVAAITDPLPAAVAAALPVATVPPVVVVAVPVPGKHRRNVYVRTMSLYPTVKR